MARLIMELLGEEAKDFLAEKYPAGQGLPDLQFQEWMITRRWAHEMARDLGEYLGIARLRAALQQHSQQPRRGATAIELATVLLEEYGLPTAPQVRGRKRELAERLHSWETLWTRLEQMPLDDIVAHVVPLFRLCETACMECVIISSEALPAYKKRVLAKLREYKVSTEPEAWPGVILDLDLGRLTSLLGSLVKRVQLEGGWAQDFQRLTHLTRLHPEIIQALEGLRSNRPQWVHGGHTVELTQARQEARAVVGWFQKLCKEGFLDLVPPVVQVVSTATDTWGNHYDVIDELDREYRAYKVTLGSDLLGRRFYLISPTNPLTIRPLLVPVIEFRRGGSLR